MQNVLPLVRIGVPSEVQRGQREWALPKNMGDALDQTFSQGAVCYDQNAYHFKISSCVNARILADSRRKRSGEGFFACGVHCQIAGHAQTRGVLGQLRASADEERLG